MHHVQTIGIAVKQSHEIVERKLPESPLLSKDDPGVGQLSASFGEIRSISAGTLSDCIRLLGENSQETSRA